VFKISAISIARTDRAYLSSGIQAIPLCVDIDNECVEDGCAAKQAVSEYRSDTSINDASTRSMSTKILRPNQRREGLLL